MDRWRLAGGNSLNRVRSSQPALGPFWAVPCSPRAKLAAATGAVLGAEPSDWDVWASSDFLLTDIAVVGDTARMFQLTI